VRASTRGVRVAGSALLGFALLVAPPLVAQPATTPAGARPPGTAPVVPPKLRVEKSVTYPDGARGDVTVTLVVVVGPDGRVRSAEPLGDAPEPFASHAANAVLDFEYEPATRAGAPVAAKIRLELHFVEPHVGPDAAAPTTATVPPTSPGAVTPPAPPPQKPEDPTEVVVVGVRPEPSRTVSLTRAEVREIPGTFGDPFRAVEALPGVTPIVSGLPFFFVRGAPPGNVGYFLDGVKVPVLFHVGVGPSVVNPALIDRVDFYPAGYPARYGRFAGGIVAGETLPADVTLHGEYNLRAFDAGALAEAPFAGGRGAALLGGRYSYTALLLSLLSSTTTLDYWDYQARIGYELGPRDRVEVFSFGSYDYVGERTPTETLTLFGTEFHRIDLRYDHRFSARGKLRTAVTLGLDRSRLQASDRKVRERLTAARNELEYRLSPNALFRAGTDFTLETYDIELGPSDLSPTAARIARNFPSRTDLAVAGRGDFVLRHGRLEVTPGVRFDLYASDGESALGVDPRLAWRVQATKHAAVLGVAGVAHQPPAFVVPIPGFQPGGLPGGLQRALQESLGLELLLGGGMTLTTTVFQNAFFHMSDPLGAAEPLANGCPPGSYPSDTLGGDLGQQPREAATCGERFTPGTLGPDRSGGGGQAADSRGGRRIGRAFEVRTLGSAYGFELLLKRRLTQRLGGFLSYTLSRSTRSYERRRYVAAFDRTHVANAAAAYDLGRGFRVGGRVVFYTGLPTPAVADTSSTRLPAFFRLDVRGEKKFRLGERMHLSIVAEWLNATLSKEAVTTTCTLQGCEAQMIGPITIPSLGVEGAF
jgi:hypothetical protein